VYRCCKLELIREFLLLSPISYLCSVSCLLFSISYLLSPSAPSPVSAPTSSSILSPVSCSLFCLCLSPVSVSILPAPLPFCSVSCLCLLSPVSYLLSPPVSCLPVSYLLSVSRLLFPVSHLPSPLSPLMVKMQLDGNLIASASPRVKNDMSDILNSSSVLEVLQPVQDPELRKSLVELNMIRNVKIDDGKVSFTLVLTTPACPPRIHCRRLPKG